MLSPTLRWPIAELRSFTAFAETPLIRSQDFVKRRTAVPCIKFRAVHAAGFRCPFDTREENRLICWEPPFATAGRSVRHPANVNKIVTIPRSRHDPKILGVDDTEIVGDRITNVRPIPRNFFTQETERRIGELGASRVGFIVRDMLVHHAP